MESATSDAAAIDLQSGYGQGGYADLNSWAGLIMGCSNLKHSKLEAVAFTSERDPEMHMREFLKKLRDREASKILKACFRLVPQDTNSGCVELISSVWMQEEYIMLHSVLVSHSDLGKGCSQILRRRPARLRQP